MQKRKTRTKNKKIVFSISQRDYTKLTSYAREKGLSRPAAVKAIVRERMKDYTAKPVEKPAPNQLNIFDMMQLTIFDKDPREGR